VSAAELVAVAADAAHAAGAELVVRHGRAGEVEAKSSPTDPVSDADRAAERTLVAALRTARPDDAIIGEEGARETGASGLAWVLDPLDGTVNYLYGFPGWCVSVACEDPEGGLAAAITDPVRGETFTAARGEGAQLTRPDNATPEAEAHIQSWLQVNNPVEPGHALIATGFPYDREHRRRQAERVARVIPAVRDIRRAGSAALDLCWLAAGRVDGYYENPTKRCDWAAGALIAAEAGARVSIVDGDGGDAIVGAGPALYGPLAELVGLPG
jgi:myo-inositol-1(or 4)-monophosphatase